MQGQASPIERESALQQDPQIIFMHINVLETLLQNCGVTQLPLELLLAHAFDYPFFFF